MFYMSIIQNDTVLHEREYYSAIQCVEKMVAAHGYYRDQDVEILMKDKNKALIIRINAKEELEMNPIT